MTAEYGFHAPELIGDQRGAVTGAAITAALRRRVAASWRALVRGDDATAPLQPPPPQPGERVLRLYVGGVLDIPIPDGLEEDGEGWDEWFADALEEVIADGRWDDCTGIDDSVVGVLDERYRVQ